MQQRNHPELLKTTQPHPSSVDKNKIENNLMRSQSPLSKDLNKQFLQFRDQIIEYNSISKPVKYEMKVTNDKYEIFCQESQGVRVLTETEVNILKYEIKAQKYLRALQSKKLKQKCQEAIQEIKILKLQNENISYENQDKKERDLKSKMQQIQKQISQIDTRVDQSQKNALFEKKNYIQRVQKRLEQLSENIKIQKEKIQLFHKQESNDQKQNTEKLLKQQSNKFQLFTQTGQISLQTRYQVQKLKKQIAWEKFSLKDQIRDHDIVAQRIKSEQKKAQNIMNELKQQYNVLQSQQKQLKQTETTRVMFQTKRIELGNNVNGLNQQIQENKQIQSIREQEFENCKKQQYDNMINAMSMYSPYFQVSAFYDGNRFPNCLDSNIVRSTYDQKYQKPQVHQSFGFGFGMRNSSGPDFARENYLTQKVNQIMYSYDIALHNYNQKIKNKRILIQQAQQQTRRLAQASRNNLGAHDHLAEKVKQQDILIGQVVKRREPNKMAIQRNEKNYYEIDKSLSSLHQNLKYYDVRKRVYQFYEDRKNMKMDLRQKIEDQKSQGAKLQQECNHYEKITEQIQHILNSGDSKSILFQVLTQFSQFFNYNNALPKLDLKDPTNIGDKIALLQLIKTKIKQIFEGNKYHSFISSQQMQRIAYQLNIKLKFQIMLIRLRPTGNLLQNLFNKYKQYIDIVIGFIKECLHMKKQFCQLRIGLIEQEDNRVQQAQAQLNTKQNQLINLQQKLITKNQENISHKQKTEQIKNSTQKILEFQSEKRNLQPQNDLKLLDIIVKKLRKIEIQPQIQEVQKKLQIKNYSGNTFSMLSLKNVPLLGSTEQKRLNEIKVISRVAHFYEEQRNKKMSLLGQKQKYEQKIQQIAEYKQTNKFLLLQRVFNIKGIKICGYDSYDTRKLNQLEMVIASIISFLNNKNNEYKLNGLNILPQELKIKVVRAFDKLKYMGQKVKIQISDIQKIIEVLTKLQKTNFSITFFEENFSKKNISIGNQTNNNIIVIKQGSGYYTLLQNNIPSNTDNEMEIYQILYKVKKSKDLFKKSIKKSIQQKEQKNINDLLLQKIMEVARTKIKQSQQIKNIKQFNSMILANQKQTALFCYLTFIYSIFNKLYLTSQLKKQSDAIVNELKQFYREMFQEFITNVKFEKDNQIRKNRQRAQQYLFGQIKQKENLTNVLKQQILKQQEIKTISEFQLSNTVSLKQKQEQNYKKISQQLLLKQKKAMQTLSGLTQLSNVLKSEGEKNVQALKTSISNIQRGQKQLQQISEKKNDIQRQIKQKQEQVKQIKISKTGLQNSKKIIDIEQRHKKQQKMKIERNVQYFQVFIKFMERLKQVLSMRQSYNKRQAILKSQVDSCGLEKIYSNIVKQLGQKQIFSDNAFSAYDRIILQEFTSHPLDVSYKYGQHLSNILKIYSGKPILQLLNDQLEVKAAVVSYQNILNLIRQEVEYTLKQSIQAISFKNDCFFIQPSNYVPNLNQSLNRKIMQIIDQKIQTKHQTHQIEKLKQLKGAQWINLINDLKISYKQIVPCIVSQVNIIASNKLFMDTSDYYPGVSVVINCGTIQFGRNGEPICINVSGKNGDEYSYKKASSARHKRIDPQRSTGDTGFDGGFGKDGQHSGHISIKAHKNIINLNLLLAISANGGNGSIGQLGGDGDSGLYGKDGDDGVAPGTQGVGGGQTSVQFGFLGSKSGPGGKAGLSGKSGRAGKQGKVQFVNKNNNSVVAGIKTQTISGVPAKDCLQNVSEKDRPKGGAGGPPTAIGADQLHDKPGFFYKTRTYKGWIIPQQFKSYFLGIGVGSQDLKSKFQSDFYGKKIDYTYLLGLGHSKRFDFQVRMNEQEYKNTPRRSNITKGDSHQQDQCQYRNQSERNGQQTQKQQTNASIFNYSRQDQINKQNEKTGKHEYSNYVLTQQNKISQMSVDIDQLDRTKRQINSQINSREETIKNRQKQLKQLQKQKSAIQTKEQIALNNVIINTGQLIPILQHTRNNRDLAKKIGLQLQKQQIEISQRSKFNTQVQNRYQQLMNFFNRVIMDKHNNLVFIKSKLVQLKNQQRQSQQFINNFKKQINDLVRMQESQQKLEQITAKDQKQIENQLQYMGSIRKQNQSQLQIIIPEKDIQKQSDIQQEQLKEQRITNVEQPKLMKQVLRDLEKCMLANTHQRKQQNIQLFNSVKLSILKTYFHAYNQQSQTHLIKLVDVVCKKIENNITSTTKYVYSLNKVIDQVQIKANYNYEQLVEAVQIQDIIYSWRSAHALVKHKIQNYQKLPTKFHLIDQFYTAFNIQSIFDYFKGKSKEESRQFYQLLSEKTNLTSEHDKSSYTQKLAENIIQYLQNNKIDFEALSKLIENSQFGLETLYRIKNNLQATKKQNWSDQMYNFLSDRISMLLSNKNEAITQLLSQIEQKIQGNFRMGEKYIQNRFQYLPSIKVINFVSKITKQLYKVHQQFNTIAQTLIKQSKDSQENQQFQNFICQLSTSYGDLFKQKQQLNKIQNRNQLQLYLNRQYESKMYEIKKQVGDFYIYEYEQIINSELKAQNIQMDGLLYQRALAQNKIGNTNQMNITLQNMDNYFNRLQQIQQRLYQFKIQQIKQNKQNSNKNKDEIILIQSILESGYANILQQYFESKKTQKTQLQALKKQIMQMVRVYVYQNKQDIKHHVDYISYIQLWLQKYDYLIRQLQNGDCDFAHRVIYFSNLKPIIQQVSQCNVQRIIYQNINTAALAVYDHPISNDFMASLQNQYEKRTQNRCISENIPQQFVQLCDLIKQDESINVGKLDSLNNVAIKLTKGKQEIYYDLKQLNTPQRIIAITQLLTFYNINKIVGLVNAYNTENKDKKIDILIQIMKRFANIIQSGVINESNCANLEKFMEQLNQITKFLIFQDRKSQQAIVKLTVQIEKLQKIKSLNQISKQLRKNLNYKIFLFTKFSLLTQQAVQFQKINVQRIKHLDIYLRQHLPKIFSYFKMIQTKNERFIFMKRLMGKLLRLNKIMPTPAQFQSKFNLEAQKQEILKFQSCNTDIKNYIQILQAIIANPRQVQQNNDLGRFAINIQTIKFIKDIQASTYKNIYKILLTNSNQLSKNQNYIRLKKTLQRKYEIYLKIETFNKLTKIQRLKAMKYSNEKIIIRNMIEQVLNKNNPNYDIMQFYQEWYKNVSKNGKDDKNIQTMKQLTKYLDTQLIAVGQKYNKIQLLQQVSDEYYKGDKLLFEKMLQNMENIVHTNVGASTENKQTGSTDQLHIEQEMKIKIQLIRGMKIVYALGQQEYLALGRLTQTESLKKIKQIQEYLSLLSQNKKDQNQKQKIAVSLPVLGIEKVDDKFSLLSNRILKKYVQQAKTIEDLRLTILKFCTKYQAKLIDSILRNFSTQLDDQEKQMIHSDSNSNQENVEYERQLKQVIKHLLQFPISTWREQLFQYKLSLQKDKISNSLALKYKAKNRHRISQEINELVSRSRFFAKQKGLLQQWLIVIQKIAKISKKQNIHNIKFIIQSVEDFKDYNEIIKIIDKCMNASTHLLYLRIVESFKQKQMTNYNVIVLHCKLLDLRLDLQSQKNKQVNRLFKILGLKMLQAKIQNNLDFIKVGQILELLSSQKNILSKQMLEKAQSLSMTSLKSYIQKKILQLKIESNTFFKHQPKRQIVLAKCYLYRTQRYHGFNLVEKLLYILNHSQIAKGEISEVNNCIKDIASLHSIKIQFIDQLEKLPVKKWNEKIKESLKIQNKDLSIKQIMKIMRQQNKIKSGGVNSSLKNYLTTNNDTQLCQMQIFMEKLRKRTNEYDNLSIEQMQIKAKTYIGLSRLDAFSWNKDNFVEIVLLLSRSLQISKGFKPRVTQLLAVILFLDPNIKSKGRFGNISTGQGKSPITAMVAAAQALIGEKVDVITSSKILAIRDASDDKEQGYKSFYQNLGLKVSNNCDKVCEQGGQTGQKQRTKRYEQCSVIYGEIGYFQRDLLLTKFYNKNIRNREVGDSLILDEADNMVIDNADKTLYISHHITDMRHLRDVFLHIWGAVNSNDCQQQNSENKRKIFLYLEELIETQVINVPKTLMSFLKLNLESWIQNAYVAKYTSQNDSYIICELDAPKPGQILVIDKRNGVEQLNTRLSNGLHIFLQLKHSRRLSDETLKAIFIPNISFIGLYKYLSGMTGTLGEKVQRKLIGKQLQVDFFELPRYRPYKFIYDSNSEKVCSTKRQRNNQILFNIESKLHIIDDMSKDSKEQLSKKVQKLKILHISQKSKRESFIQQIENKKKTQSAIKQQLGKQQIIKQLYKTYLYMKKNQEQNFKDLSVQIKNALQKQQNKYLLNLNTTIEMQLTKQNKKQLLKALNQNLVNNTRQITQNQTDLKFLQQKNQVIEFLTSQQVDQQQKIKNKVSQLKKFNQQTQNKIKELSSQNIEINIDLSQTQSDIIMIEQIVNKNHQNLQEISNSLKQLSQKLFVSNQSIKNLQFELSQFASQYEEQQKLQQKPKRAILIIAQNIEQVQNIKSTILSRLSDKISKGLYKVYEYTLAYKKFTKNKLQAGDIIIATNIAGRGTDLKVSRFVEANGGLHIILSYAAGKRERGQALGRTARSGDKGSGTAILYSSKQKDTNEIFVDQLVNQIDQKQNNYLESISHELLNKIKFEYELFGSHFVRLKKKVEQHYQDNKDQSMKSSCHFQSMKLQLESLNNHWAFWLNSMADEIQKSNQKESRQKIITEFKKFEKQILQKIDNKQFGLVIQPSELLKLGRIYFDEGYFDKAYKCLTIIIEQHEKFSEAAYMYRAMSVIQLEGGGQNGQKKAKKDAKRAFSLIEQKRNMIMERPQLLSSINSFNGRKIIRDVDQFKLQQQGQAHILSVHLNCIQEVIGTKGVQSKNFKDSEINQSQAKELFKQLAQVGIIENYRLSKKIKEQNGIFYKITNKNEQIKLEVPQEFKYCQVQIFDKLKALSQQKNKIISPQTYFEEIIYTVQEFKKDIQGIVKMQQILCLSKDILQILNNQQKNPKLLNKTAEISSIIKANIEQQKKKTQNKSESVTIKRSLLQSQLKRNSNLNDEQIYSIIQYLKKYQTLLIQKIVLQSKMQNSNHPSVYCNKKNEIKQELQRLLNGKEEKQVQKQIVFDAIQKILGHEKSMQADKIIKQLSFSKGTRAITHTVNQFILSPQACKKIQLQVTAINILPQRNQMIELVNLSEGGWTSQVSSKIKQILLTKKEPITQKDLNINQIQFSKLRAMLIDNKVIDAPLLSKLIVNKQLLIEQKYNQLKKQGLKLNFKQFVMLAESDDELVGGTKTHPQLQFCIQFIYHFGGSVLESKLPLKNKSAGSCQIFNYLVANKIIKEPKVNYKAVSQSKIQQVISKALSLSRQLGGQIADYTTGINSKNNTKIDDLIQSIQQTLRKLAGKLNIAQKVKLQYKQLMQTVVGDSVSVQLLEYIQMKFDKIISFNEEKPFDWNIVACAMIGVTQVVAGIAIEIFSLGTCHCLAQMFIAEGVSDMMFSVEAGITGDFSWKKYGKHKVQSLVISILTMGVGSIVGKIKGTAAQSTKIAFRLAQKRVIFMTIAKTTLLHACQAVSGALIKVGTNQLSKMIMNEIFTQNFKQKLDDWMSKDPKYQNKKNSLQESLTKIYKKFRKADVDQMINDCIERACKDMETQQLSSQILDKVGEVMEEAFSAVGKSMQKSQSKGGFATLMKILTFAKKVAKLAQISKKLYQIYKLSTEFIEKLQQQLRQAEETYQRQNKAIQVWSQSKDFDYTGEAKIKMDLVTKNIHKLLKKMIQKQLLSPLLKKGLKFVTSPIIKLVTKPLERAMDDLKEHIQQRANKFMLRIMMKQNSVLPILKAKYKRGLQDMKMLQSVPMDLLSQKPANFDFTLQQLQNANGSSLRIMKRYNKIYAVLPTHKQFSDHIADDKYGGMMHLQAAADKSQCTILVGRSSDEDMMFSRDNVLLKADGTHMTVQDFKNNLDSGSLSQGEIKPLGNKVSKRTIMMIRFVGDPQRQDKQQKMGHFAPVVVENDGKLRMIDIPQIKQTRGQCLAQSVLIATNFQSKTQDQPTSKFIERTAGVDSIKQFNQNLGDYCKKDKNLREFYQSSITVKYSDKLGGVSVKILPGGQIKLNNDVDEFSSDSRRKSIRSSEQKHKQHWVSQIRPTFQDLLNLISNTKAKNLEKEINKMYTQLGYDVPEEMNKEGKIQHLCSIINPSFDDMIGSSQKRRESSTKYLDSERAFEQSIQRDLDQMEEMPNSYHQKSPLLRAMQEQDEQLYKTHGLTMQEENNIKMKQQYEYLQYLGSAQKKIQSKDCDAAVASFVSIFKDMKVQHNAKIKNKTRNRRNAVV